MERFITEQFVPGYFEKEFTLELTGGSIHGMAVSEDFVFYGEDGSAEASLFTQAYLRTDITPSERERRPVMFLWNGGPGSASSMLQLECFGPWLIGKDAEDHYEYRLFQDPSCILDQVDLVYIDQVGVGYSRLLNLSVESKYCSVDGDARIYAFTMLNWLRKHNRIANPYFICGESYGTIRACRVVAELGRSPFSESRMVPGVPPKGVILVGNATSMDASSGEILMDGISMTQAMMPAMAATNYYHHPDGKGTMQEFLNASWEFAANELTGALFMGRDITPERKQKTAEQLAYYTGMQTEYFLRHDLQVADPEDFMMQVAADLGCRIDLYDGRVKIPFTYSYNSIGSSDNVPLKIMNQKLREIQGIESDRIYYTGNLSQNWNYETEDVPGKKTHLQCLEAAMKANPDLRLMFASGLFDLCTHVGNTRYQVAHSDLPSDRTIQREYPGGHGVYSSPEGKQRFLSDVRNFIAGNEIDE